MNALQVAKKFRKKVLNRQHPSVEIIHQRTGTPKGGYTAIRYWVTKGSEVTGISFCWEQDTYSKIKGKSIAFGRVMRALDVLGLSKRMKNYHYSFILRDVGKIDQKLFQLARDGEEIE